MALLEQHPPHVRKRIALLWTGLTALVLIGIFLIIYIGKPKNESGDENTSRFKDLYETISEGTQSFFSGNKGIMEE